MTITPPPRADSQDEFTGETTSPGFGESYHRARRATQQIPVLKVAGLVIGIFGMLITIATIVWGASSLVNSKADTDDLHEVEREIGGIQTQVEVIKVEQRALIREIAPRVKTGDR